MLETLANFDDVDDITLMYFDILENCWLLTFITTVNKTQIYKQLQ